MRYRDIVSEGYDITPNFFIYGYIGDIQDFTSSKVLPKDNVIQSYHWKYRLFDRDTLFIHQYEINFLYVLKSYSESNYYHINDFRTTTKRIFRDNMLKYFRNEPVNSTNSSFDVFEFEDSNPKKFVEENFKLLIGKSIITSEGKLLIAVHKEDKNEELRELTKGLKKFQWL